MSGRQEASNNNFKFPWILQISFLARELLRVQLPSGSLFHLLLPRLLLKKTSASPVSILTAPEGLMDSLRSVALAHASYSFNKLRTAEFTMSGGTEIKPSLPRDSIAGNKPGQANMAVADWRLSCLLLCQDKLTESKALQESMAFNSSSRFNGFNDIDFLLDLVVLFFFIYRTRKCQPLRMRLTDFNSCQF